MICPKCRGETQRLRCVGNLIWVCLSCVPLLKPPEWNSKKHVFAVIPTVNFRYYYKNKGNMSAARIKMMKSRYIVPDGNGEVAMKDSLGRKTDKSSYNY